MRLPEPLETVCLWVTEAREADTRMSVEGEISR
jgi:hypothetical protein